MVNGYFPPTEPGGKVIRNTPNVWLLHSAWDPEKTQI